MNCPEVFYSILSKGTYSISFQIADVISIILPEKNMQKIKKKKEVKDVK